MSYRIKKKFEDVDAMIFVGGYSAISKVMEFTGKQVCNVYETGGGIGCSILMGDGHTRSLYPGQCILKCKSTGELHIITSDAFSVLFEEG